MCRSTTTDYHQYQPQRRRIKITSFYLRLCLSSPSADFLPDSLTLVLLPRLTASLHINGSKVLADSPAFLSLHRVLCPDDKAALFASKDRLRASDGLSFEVHLAQHRLLKGVVHRDDHTAASWSMKCKCDGDIGVGVDVREAEISVALEGGRVVTERVTPVKSRRRRCQRWRFQMDLEDIPEEEYDYESGSSDTASSLSCCGCCCDDFASSESDGEDELDNEDYHKDVDMYAKMEVAEGAGWAADVGFWALCLGVGLLVSAASARRLSRRKLLR